MSSNRNTYIIAAILLLIMGIMAFFSMRGDSATMDELSHIPAGYSYVSQKDMRINPEHPPLIKDLGGLLPYLFLNVNFPKDHESWTKDVNGQWWFGETLLYKSGNDADKIIFLARIPMIFVMLILGFFVFLFAKEIGGNPTGILALTFYVFSPTFLAHGRYVTTDVAAALGFFIGIYYFLKFLKNPSKKNLIFAGIAYGIAQVLKFTVFLLTPAIPILAIIWVYARGESIKKRLILSFLVLAIGFLLIYPVYLLHVWNLPIDRQIQDTQALLGSTPFKALAKLDIWMASIPVLRPFAYYFLGLLLVFQRGIFGHTTYFLGEVSAGGWKYYFPIVYFIKTQLAFHILTLIALIFGLKSIKKPYRQQMVSRIKAWIKENFAVFSMIAFVLAYWLVSLSGNLTLGVRHLSPIFPFMFVLISLGTVKILNALRGKSLMAGKILFIILLAWYIIPVILLYPHFLTYFNFVAGGPSAGSRYVVDSNLDWGQDLKRLKNWVDENNIEKIKIDYFGGGNPKYYFGEIYEKFDAKSGPQKGWLAISASPLKNGQGRPAPGFKEPTGYYNWLKEYEPITVIGNSIFVYYID